MGFAFSFIKEEIMDATKIVLFLFVSFIINFLEFGFIYDTSMKIIYAFVLMIVIFLVTISKRIRFISLVIALLLIGLMAILFIFKQIVVSNQIGSFGFSILLISLIAYLPRMILKGYIDNFR